MSINLAREGASRAGSDVSYRSRCGCIAVSQANARFLQDLEVAAESRCAHVPPSAPPSGIGNEEVVLSADAWLPVAVVQLTLMEMRLFGRSRAGTSQAWAVYDLLAGTFVTRLDEEPPRDPVVLDGGVIKHRLKLKEPAKKLDDVIAKYDKVTSDDAKAKYRAQLANLGVPDMHTATTGTSSPFLYPVHLAIARQKGGTERIVAVDAFRSRIDDDLSLEMSKSIAWIRESLGF